MYWNNKLIKKFKQHPLHLLCMHVLDTTAAWIDTKPLQKNEINLQQTEYIPIQEKQRKTCISQRKACSRTQSWNLPSEDHFELRGSPFSNQTRCSWFCATVSAARDLEDSSKLPVIVWFSQIAWYGRQILQFSDCFVLLMKKTGWSCNCDCTLFCSTVSSSSR